MSVEPAIQLDLLSLSITERNQPLSEPLQDAQLLLWSSDQTMMQVSGERLRLLVLPLEEFQRERAASIAFEEAPSASAALCFQIQARERNNSNAVWTRAGFIGEWYQIYRLIMMNRKATKPIALKFQPTGGLNQVYKGTLRGQLTINPALKDDDVFVKSIGRAESTVERGGRAVARFKGIYFSQIFLMRGSTMQLALHREDAGRSLVTLFDLDNHELIKFHRPLWTLPVGAHMRFADWWVLRAASEMRWTRDEWVRLAPFIDTLCSIGRRTAAFDDKSAQALSAALARGTVPDRSLLVRGCEALAYTLTEVVNFCRYAVDVRHMAHRAPSKLLRVEAPSRVLAAGARNTGDCEDLDALAGAVFMLLQRRPPFAGRDGVVSKETDVILELADHYACLHTFTTVNGDSLPDDNGERMHVGAPVQSQQTTDRTKKLILSYYGQMTPPYTAPSFVPPGSSTKRTAALSLQKHHETAMGIWFQFSRNHPEHVEKIYSVLPEFNNYPHWMMLAHLVHEYIKTRDVFPSRPLDENMLAELPSEQSADLYTGEYKSFEDRIARKELFSNYWPILFALNALVVAGANVEQGAVSVAINSAAREEVHRLGALVTAGMNPDVDPRMFEKVMGDEQRWVTIQWDDVQPSDAALLVKWLFSAMYLHNLEYVQQTFQDTLPPPNLVLASVELGENPLLKDDSGDYMDILARALPTGAEPPRKRKRIEPQAIIKFDSVESDADSDSDMASDGGSDFSGASDDEDDVFMSDMTAEEYMAMCKKSGQTQKLRDYAAYLINTGDGEHDALVDRFSEYTSRDFALLRTHLATIGDGLRVSQSNVGETLKSMYPDNPDIASADSGQGLFATRAFKKNELVTAYEGARIDLSELNPRDIPAQVLSHLKRIPTTQIGIAGSVDAQGRLIKPAQGLSAGPFANTANVRGAEPTADGSVRGANAKIIVIDNALCDTGSTKTSPCDFLGVILATDDIEDGDEILVDYALGNTLSGRSVSDDELRAFVRKHLVECEEQVGGEAHASTMPPGRHMPSHGGHELEIGAMSEADSQLTDAYLAIQDMWRRKKRQYQKRTGGTDAPAWREVYATRSELLGFFAVNFESVVQLVTEGRKYEETGQIPPRIQAILDDYPVLFWMSAAAHLGRAKDAVNTLIQFYYAIQTDYVGARLNENIKRVRDQLGADRFYRNIATWIEFFSLSGESASEHSYYAFYPTMQQLEFANVDALEVVLFLNHLMAYKGEWIPGMTIGPEEATIVGRAQSAVYSVARSPLLNVSDMELGSDDDGDNDDDEGRDAMMDVGESMRGNEPSGELILRALRQHAPAMVHFYTLLRDRISFDAIAQATGFGSVDSSLWMRLVEVMAMYEYSKSQFLHYMFSKDLARAGAEPLPADAIDWTLSTWGEHFGLDSAGLLREIFSDKWTLDYYTFIFMQDTPLSPLFVRIEELGRLALMAADKDPFDIPTTNEQLLASSSSSSEDSDSGIVHAAAERLQLMLVEIERHSDIIRDTAQHPPHLELGARHNRDYLRSVITLWDKGGESPLDVMGDGFIDHYLVERLAMAPALVVMQNVRSNPMLHAMRRYNKARFWLLIIRARYGETRFKALQLAMEEDAERETPKSWGSAFLWIEKYERFRFEHASAQMHGHRSAGRAVTTQWPLWEMHYEDSIHVHFQHTTYTVDAILQSEQFASVRYPTLSEVSIRGQVLNELARQDRMCAQSTACNTQTELLIFRKTADYAMHGTTRHYRRWLGANENYAVSKGKPELLSGAPMQGSQHRPECMLIGTPADKSAPITGHMLSLLVPLHSLSATYEKHGIFMRKHFGSGSAGPRADADSPHEKLLARSRALARRYVADDHMNAEADAWRRAMADALPTMVAEGTGRQEPLLHSDEFYFGTSDEVTYRAMRKLAAMAVEARVHRTLMFMDGIEEIESYNRQAASLHSQLQDIDSDGLKRDVRLSNFYRHVGHSVSLTLKDIHPHFHHMLWVNPRDMRFGCNMRYALEGRDAMPVPSDSVMRQAYESGDIVIDGRTPVDFKRFSYPEFVDKMVNEPFHAVDAAQRIRDTSYFGMSIDWAAEGATDFAINIETAKESGQMPKGLPHVSPGHAPYESTVTLAVRATEPSAFANAVRALKKEIAAASLTVEYLTPAPGAEPVLRIVVPIKCQVVDQ